MDEDPEYREMLGEIIGLIERNKIEGDLRPVLFSCMTSLEKALQEKGYGQCEIKILIDLPKVGWVRYWNKNKLEEDG